jgi:uncharacterized protein YdaU (DUF1376 family)
MAERWQQWMPFHIDRFRGSPDVRAMHPAAQMGYLYLLASAWQTEDCTVSADDLDLAADSCLGDELWEKYKARILRKFEEVSEGRLRNQTAYEEWKGARNKFESKILTPEEQEDLRQKRSAAGKAGNEKRWGNRKFATEESQTIATCDEEPSKPIANDRLTLTGTLTSTGTKTKNKEPKNPAIAVVIPLPVWLDKDAWEAYLDMRRKKRCSPTPRAIELIFKKLEGYEAKGLSSTDALNNSTESSYQGIFEPKTGGTNGTGKRTKSDANYAAFQQVMGTEEGPQTIDSRSLDNPRGDTERRSQQADHSGGVHRGDDAGEPSAVHPGVQPRARNVQVLPEPGRAARLLFPA